MHTLLPKDVWLTSSRLDSHETKLFQSMVKVLAPRCSSGHNTGDLTENSTDAGGDVGHDRPAETATKRYSTLRIRDVAPSCCRVLPFQPIEEYEWSAGNQLRVYPRSKSST